MYLMVVDTVSCGSEIYNLYKLTMPASKYIQDPVAAVVATCERIPDARPFASWTISLHSVIAPGPVCQTPVSCYIHALPQKIA